MSSPTWDEFAELALKRITASGAEYGDIRIQDSGTKQVQGRICLRSVEGTCLPRL